MKTVAYVRSATSPRAVERQLVQIRSWAQSSGLEVDEVFQDVAPGLSLERAGLKSLAGAIDRGDIERVIVVGLDRLTRDIKLTQPLIEAFAARGVGIHDLSAGLGLDTLEGLPDPRHAVLIDLFPPDRRRSSGERR